MNANQVTAPAAEALSPREVEFLTLLLKVRPEDRGDVLRELSTTAEAFAPATARR